MTVEDMAKMRAAGRSLQEIGDLAGMSFQSVHRRVGQVESPRLWGIESAAELRTWLAVRKELHVHHEREKDGQSRWMLV